MKKVIFLLSLLFFVNLNAQEIFISDYIDGYNDNKAISIYNPSSKVINLSEYNLQIDINGKGEYKYRYQLQGQLAPKAKKIYAHAQASDISIYSKADTIRKRVVDFNGNDVLGLFKGNTLIDRLGVPGGKNFAKDKLLKRKQNYLKANPNSSMDEWDVYKENNFTRELLDWYICPGLVISEYNEGDWHNKFVKLTNRSSSRKYLSNYSIYRNKDGNSSHFSESAFPEYLEPGESFYIVNSHADTKFIKSKYCVLNSGYFSSFNGDDDIYLKKGSKIIDHIGLGDGTKYGERVNFKRKHEITMGSIGRQDPRTNGEWIKSSYSMQSMLNSSLVNHLDKNLNYTSTAPIGADYKLNKSLAVGFIAGQASVSNTGAATYTMPITVPPGVKGMQPKLAVNYSSQSGDGIMGKGFNFSGISAIMRVGQNIYFDGRVRGVNVDKYDRYALDGQRLINTSGSYGEANSVYQTEIENFSKIKQFESGASQYFRVYTEDGRVLEYKYKHKLSGKSNVFAWYLSKMIDVHGNEVNYEYFTEDGVTYLNMVTYSVNSVKFKYGKRNDVKTSYVVGAEIKNTYKLNEIEVYAGEKLYRKFCYSYCLDELKKTKLVQVDQENAKGEKLNPVVFEWGTNNAPVFSNSSSSYTSQFKDLIKDRKHIKADFNGDGQNDLISLPVGEFKDSDSLYVYISENSMMKLRQGISLYGVKNVYVGDFDHDGDSDFYLRKWQSVNKDVYWYNFTITRKNGQVNNFKDYYQDPNEDAIVQSWISSGDKLSNVTKYRHHIFYKRTLLLNGYSYSNSQFVRNSSIDESFSFNQRFAVDDKVIYTPDLDGDKKLDFIILNKDKSVYSIKTSNNGYIDDIELTHPIKFCDLNSNGKTELFEKIENKFKLYEVEDSKLKLLINGELPEKTIYVNFGDFNGDGNQDIFASGLKNTKSTVLRNNGNLTFSNIDISNILGTKEKLTDYDVYRDRFITLDFNGDGLTDIIRLDADYYHDHKWYKIGSIKDFDFDHGTVKWFKSNGKTFDLEREMRFSDDNDLLCKYFTVGDFNYDGKADLLAYSKYDFGGIHDKKQWVLFTFSNNKYYGKVVKKIQNIEETNFTYKSLYETSVYKKGSDIIPNTINIINSMKVVSCISSNDRQVNYFYKDAKIHLLGRGFLGFSEIKKTKKYTKETIIDKFLIDKNYFVPLHHDAIKYKAGILVSKQIKNNKILNLSNKRLQIYTPSTIIDNYIDNTRQSVSTILSSSNKPKEIVTKYKRMGQSFDDVIKKQILSYESINFNGFDFTDAKLSSTKTSTIYHQKPEFVEQVSYSYLSNGALKSQTQNNIVTSYKYDNKGNVVETNNTVGGEVRTSKLKFDETYRFPIEKSNLLGQKELFSYNNMGQVVATTDVYGNKGSKNYDSWGELVSEQFNGVTTTYQKGWSGDNDSQSQYWTRHSAPKSPTKTTFYDAKGRKVKSVTQNYFDEIHIDYLYNAKGQLEKVSQPYESATPTQWNIHEYDSLGRETKLTTFNNLITETLYSPGKVTTIFPNRTSKTITKNAVGDILSTKDNGGTINYSYHSSGQPELISCNGSETKISYTQEGLQESLTDPDAGKITYVYTKWGDIHSQTDANAKYTQYDYDKYGRMIERECDGIVTDYKYVPLGQNGAGLLQSETMGSVTTQYTYDKLGQLLSKIENIEGEIFQTQFEYDLYGNNTKKIFPSGKVQENLYDGKGFLYNIKFQNESVWSLTNVNKYGQITDYLLGTTHAVKTKYDANLQLESIQTHLKGNTIQEWKYGFDKLTNNMEFRQNVTHNLMENFEFDKLDRLTSSEIPGDQIDVTYHSNGNIKSKEGLGNYYYDGVQPHALTSVDNSDDLIHSNQDIAYTAFNKVASIEQNKKELLFLYDANYSRKRVEHYNQTGDWVSSHYYVGAYELIKDKEGVKSINHFIHSPSGLIMVNKMVLDREDNLQKDENYFVLKDYLGSIDLLTDGEKVVAEFSYDAWGRPRNAKTWGYDHVEKNSIFGRGYTGHEHLEEFNLINMNGRLYDPIVGRFLSPDPYIQAPDRTQNFNRYSYCLNNPLKYTDPSGEFVITSFLVAAATAAIVGAVVNVVTNMDRIDDLGEAFSYAGVGALSGFVTPIPYIGVPLSGAINGLGNYAINQKENGADFEWGSAWKQIKIGAAASVIGAGTGRYVGKCFNKLGNFVSRGISSKFAKNVTNYVTSHTLTGIVSGYTSEVTSNYLIDPDHNLNNAFKSAFAFKTFTKGGLGGFCSGFLYGTGRTYMPQYYKGTPQNSIFKSEPTGYLRLQYNVSYNRVTTISSTTLPSSHLTVPFNSPGNNFPIPIENDYKEDKVNYFKLYR